MKALAPFLLMLMLILVQPVQAEVIGFLDVANETYLYAWMCDTSFPDRPLQASIYVNGELHHKIANGLREAGVANACGGNPLHGLFFPYPKGLQNGTNDIQVYGNGVLIGRTSVEATPRPPEVYFSQPSSGIVIYREVFEADQVPSDQYGVAFWWITNPDDHSFASIGDRTVIRADSLTPHTSNLITGTPFYRFSRGLFPWRSHTMLTTELSLQVPEAVRRSEGAEAYVVAYYRYEDTTTGLKWWQGVQLFDLRPVSEALNTDSCGGQCSVPIVGGVMRGGIYGDAGELSEITRHYPWNYDTYFQYHVTLEAFKNALQRLPQNYSREPNAHRLLSIWLNPEGFSDSAIRIEFTGWKVYTQ